MIEAPADLTEALLDGAGLIDVRAPMEQKQGSLPGSEALPLLDDEQRAAVGRRYKEAGQDAAIALGRKLVSGEDRARKMAAWLAAARAKPTARIFCFRGGLRSRSVAEALREAGEPREILEGGYKRARRFLMDASERGARSERFLVLGGRTGSGKTALLSRLAQARREKTQGARPLDLEAFARHRGSAFGSLRAEQAAQATFENALALELWRASASGGGDVPLVVEDESRLIGRVEIPAALFERMSTAPIYLIDEPRERRARFLASVYLSDYADAACATAAAAEFPPLSPRALQALETDVRRAVLSIQRRLGGAETSAILTMLEDAVAKHRASGSGEAHLPWAERLLESYYDPLYDKHIAACGARIAMRGDADSIFAALRESK